MTHQALKAYLERTSPEQIKPGFLAYIAALTEVAKVSPETAASIVNELAAQRENLKLIASENYSSLNTQLAMGNLLTDKYAEGYPGHRFYAGCDNIDAIEEYACTTACRLFGCDHAYVQPHSGADANLIAFWTILSARVQTPALAELGEENPLQLPAADWNKVRQKMHAQRLVALDLFSGGHLTHGYRHNISGALFETYGYNVDPETGLLDSDQIEELVLRVKPLILLAGYSAYPRAINYRRLREIADKVDAVLMVDMAHFAGLVAGGVFTGDLNPVPHAHIVTTTTHKTLRGPRGGMILCTKEFAEYVDKGCPYVMGGPLPHVLAAKAVALTEACSPSFREYAHKIVENSQALAAACMAEGMKVATNGTDNHMLLVDVYASFGLTGRQAESVLRACGITLNRNAMPFDPHGAWYTSGLRLGTAAITTLGMGEAEMREIAAIIKYVLANTSPKTVEEGKNAGKPSKAQYVIDEKVAEKARGRVRDLLNKYPVYPEIDLGFLQEYFVGDGKKE